MPFTLASQELRSLSMNLIFYIPNIYIYNIYLVSLLLDFAVCGICNVLYTRITGAAVAGYANLVRFVLIIYTKDYYYIIIIIYLLSSITNLVSLFLDFAICGILDVLYTRITLAAVAGEASIAGLARVLQGKGDGSGVQAGQLRAKRGQGNAKLVLPLGITFK